MSLQCNRHTARVAEDKTNSVKSPSDACTSLAPRHRDKSLLRQTAACPACQLMPQSYPSDNR